MSNKPNRFDTIQPSLSEETLSAIREFGFEFLTPVQATSIPLFLQHKDVCVEATTGSGKTLAFGIPIFEMLFKLKQKLGKYDVGAMVLAPTRELAVQIHEVFQILSKYHETMKSTLFVGGTSVQDNTGEYLKTGGQIIVGTPGRIIDIVNRTPDINFKRLEVLVLDEADKLLDMGFKDSINQILSMLPKQRRTGLFSATQTKEVKELARAGLRNPVSVSVRVQQNFSQELANKLFAPPGAASSSSVPATTTVTKPSIASSVPSTLENWYLIREYEQRPYEVMKFIQCHLDCKIIIFCATCACVEYYSQVFYQLAKDTKIFTKTVPVIGFHGKMIAKKRTALYKKFKAMPCGIMFSTDVAARGIDIPDVDWIIQMAAPKDPSFFVHRVGRTARAGKKGGALLFITPEEDAYIELLGNRGVQLLPGESMDHPMSPYFYTNQPTVTALCQSLPPQETVLQMLKNYAKQDRDILEAASTAYMSFIRAYKENLCSFIFRLEELDIGGLARAYGLLRLPKIAETRGVKGKPIVFETDPIDTSTIPYKHPEKEKARMKRLKDGKEKAELEEQMSISHGNKAGGNGKPQQGGKGVGGKPGDKKKEWVPAEEYEREDKKRDRKRKKSEFAKFQEEWEELAAEETMFKKFKKGKLSKDAYDSTIFAENSMEKSKAKMYQDADGCSDGDMSDVSDI